MTPSGSPAAGLDAGSAAGSVRIRPGPVQGRARAPPSKSVTHRAFLLGALSSEPAMVGAPLLSADTRATLACLAALGARVEVSPGAVRFEPAPLRPPPVALDCANSGTTLRLLSATCARLPARVVLTGDASLRSRPNGALLEALRSLGAQAGGAGSTGLAPLWVHGPMRPGSASLPPRTSSQFASALALSVPLLPGPSRLHVAAPVASRPYLDLTLGMARAAGIPLSAEDASGGLVVATEGNAVPRLGAWRVEGDWSAAAFPLVAACIAGGRVAVDGLDTGSPQGDRAILEHLQSFGAKAGTMAGGAWAEGGGTLASPGQVDVAGTPDLFPALAVLAACSKGATTFTGGSQLRAKETDRIAAMAEGLRRMGIQCQETADGLIVEGGRLVGAAIDAHGDHRIHMAFAVAALAAQGPSEVGDAASAQVSYPGFHDALRQLGATVEAGTQRGPTSRDGIPTTDAAESKASPMHGTLRRAT